MSFQEMLDELNSISTPGEIRDFLREKNIRGVPAKFRRCPIAMYFREAEYPVGVGAGFVHRGDGDPYRLSVPAQVFIREFDAGLYPELVA